MIGSCVLALGMSMNGNAPAELPPVPWPTEDYLQVWVIREEAPSVSEIVGEPEAGPDLWNRSWRSDSFRGRDDLGRGPLGYYRNETRLPRGQNNRPRNGN